MGGSVTLAGAEPVRLNPQLAAAVNTPPQQAAQAQDDGGPLALAWNGLSFNEKVMVIGGGVALAGLAVALAPEVIAVGSAASVATGTGTLSTILAGTGLSSHGLGLAAAAGGAASAAGAALNELTDQFGPTISAIRNWSASGSHNIDGAGNVHIASPMSRRDADTVVQEGEEEDGDDCPFGPEETLPDWYPGDDDIRLASGCI